MIIIGGMGSLLGAMLGAALRHAVSLRDRGRADAALPDAQKLRGRHLFAVNYAAFGVVMILFLLFEPQGLVGIWRRVQNLLPAVAVQAAPARGCAQMSEPLLQRRQARGRLSPRRSPRCRACR